MTHRATAYADQQAPGYRTGRSSRRGVSTTSILVALSIVGTLAGTAWIARPAYLHAKSPEHEPIAAASEHHQEVINLIADLVRSSAEVIAIHQRGYTPYVELVLRTAGEGEAMAADEIALISHSRVLQSITLYTHDDVEEAFSDLTPAGRDFPGKWRGSPQVKPRLLAAGVSDMLIDQVEPGMLRIALTWAADSADGLDNATVYVNCRLPEHAWR